MEKCRMCVGAEPHVEGSHYCCANMPDKYALACRVAELESLLSELIDIEGPQPGHAEWYKKVVDALDRSKGVV